MQQYARVPIELVRLVDANAVTVYVVLCKYAHRTTGRLWPSNAELVDETLLSLATVKRALTQLETVGAIERAGRQNRRMRVVPVETLKLTGEPKTKRSKAHQRAVYGSPVSYGTRTNELDITPPLRVGVSDESEQPMIESADEQPMFEIEPLPAKPVPVTHAALEAFFDAYGAEPVSRSMAARIAQRVKMLADTYSRDELVAACAEMGGQRVANPNAIEPFVLRARQPRYVEQRQRSQWSALAQDTFAQTGDPFRHV